MPMGSNKLKFSSCSRKRQAGFKSEDSPSDVAILSMAVDFQSLFRRSAPRLVRRGENRQIDDVFQGLLSQANRELASLLRDVRTESQGVMPGDTGSQQVSELLMRAVRCAAKQYMLQAELGSLALTDDLTGLYNRRGFMALAERQLKLGRRSGRGTLLFVVDVDHLKQINDTFGHREGDLALKCVAEAMEQTFRDSDVVARLGGDEFAVLRDRGIWTQRGHNQSSTFRVSEIHLRQGISLPNFAQSRPCAFRFGWPHIHRRIDGEGRPGYVRAQEAAIFATSR